MLIKCPSCSLSHNTEDHPGAFEILCSCGYSILVPDEAKLSEPVIAEISPSTPIAMEVEDENNKIAFPSDENVNLVPEIVIEESFELTPPEQLPQEMPYDPYEVQQQNVVSLANEVQEQETETNHELDTKSFQNIVDRSVASHMGQWVGNKFRLKAKVQPSQLVILKKQCLKLLDDQAWLYNEVKKSGIDIQVLEENFDISEVPEILALEIYLIILELGGECQIEVIS